MPDTGGLPRPRRQRAQQGPTVPVPLDRSDERLAAKVVMRPAGRTNPEQDRPRAPVLALDEVGVAGRLHGMPRPVAMGEQRPVRRRGERAVGLAAAGDDDGMAVTRPTLRREEVVPVAAPVEVRRLGPDAAGALPDDTGA